MHAPLHSLFLFIHLQNVWQIVRTLDEGKLQKRNPNSFPSPYQPWLSLYIQHILHLLRNNCLTIYNGRTVHTVLSWKAFGHLLVESFPPCLLDDTAVGLGHHHNQSATGWRSDSQSVTGTYRNPLSSPTNHLFGTRVASLSLTCVLFRLVFPTCLSFMSDLLFGCLILSCFPRSVYLFLEMGRYWATMRYLKKNEQDRWADMRTSAPLALGWAAAFSVCTKNRSLEEPSSCFFR